jgi:catechol O-methyltransferase
MTTGPPKLEIIISRLHITKPKIMLKFGSYIGWGAVAFGGLLRELHPDPKPGEVKLFTFEVDPLFAAITSSFVELAGLKDIVDVIVGSAEDSVRRLKAEGVSARADVVLLDHWEKFYLSDLQVLEELGLVGGGSVVLADNTVRAPGYLEYVRGGKGRSGAEMRSESVESIMPMGIKVTFISLEMRCANCGIGCFRGNYFRMRDNFVVGILGSLDIVILQTKLQTKCNTVE